MEGRRPTDCPDQDIGKPHMAKCPITLPLIVGNRLQNCLPALQNSPAAATVRFPAVATVKRRAGSCRPIGGADHVIALTRTRADACRQNLLFGLHARHVAQADRRLSSARHGHGRGLCRHAPLPARPSRAEHRPTFQSRWCRGAPAGAGFRQEGGSGGAMAGPRRYRHHLQDVRHHRSVGRTLHQRCAQRAGAAGGAEAGPLQQWLLSSRVCISGIWS